MGFLLMGLNCNGLKPNKTSAQMIFFLPHLTALPPRDVCTVEHIWKDSTCMSPLGIRGAPPDKCSSKMLDVLIVVSYSVEMFVLNLTLGVTNSLFTAAPHPWFCLISDEEFRFANADGRNLFVLQRFCSRLVCLPPGTFGSDQSFVLPTHVASTSHAS